MCKVTRQVTLTMTTVLSTVTGSHKMVNGKVHQSHLTLFPASTIQELLLQG